MENKKIIAEFMDRPSQICPLGNTWYYYPDKIFYVLPHELEYDSSWDWLMPVVMKCVEVNIRHDNNTDKCGHISLGIVESNIDITFNKVVEFIKWYNSNGDKS